MVLGEKLIKLSDFLFIIIKLLFNDTNYLYKANKITGHCVLEKNKIIIFAGLASTLVIETFFLYLFTVCSFGHAQVALGTPIFCATCPMARTRFWEFRTLMFHKYLKYSYFFS